MIWNYTEIGMQDGYIDRDGYWREPVELITANMNGTNWLDILDDNGGQEFAVQFNDW